MRFRLGEGLTAGDRLRSRGLPSSHHSQKVGFEKTGPTFSPRQSNLFQDALGCQPIHKAEATAIHSCRLGTSDNALNALMRGFMGFGQVDCRRTRAAAESGQNFRSVAWAYGWV
jgi:hypothetical protein